MNKNIKQCNKNEYSSSKHKYKNNYEINTYLQMTNDANYIMVSNKSEYCFKCGKELDENSLDIFCDRECKKDYYAEIKKDYDGIYFGGW